MIKIVIDSGIDQNDFMKKEYEYEFLPLSVIIKDKDYLDQKEISLKQVHEYMKQGILPKTSQISPQSLLDILNDCRSRNEDVIYISIYSQISGTFQVAHSLISEYKTNHPEMKVEVIDSLGGAGGGALLAIQALEMVKNGLSFETIVEQTRKNAKHIKYNFTLNNLNWLVKGGRVSKVAGAAGTALNIKPYLTVDHTGIIVKKLVRGQERIYKKIIKDVTDGVGTFDDQLITISHVNDLESAQKLENMVKTALPRVTTQILDLGAVLAAHLGIGGIGVFYFDEKPEHYMYINKN
ncbi:EDD domain protein, DegV family [Marinilactibacillus piezotolerans]|uniref:EDD domain protein, DegV family n=1 Tax=Marinilactibacillus piezotolerans TaxID=258723 RepID=A0A1I3X9C1_9LACT|nr:DegV family protein [Marinilactibacillus piezotolerans]SFK16195.1 EDD domain protein, DegV family [Marinilactibacillus piezotolerans]